MAEKLIAGRYRLETLLGRGGMSEVWCAMDEELDRRVALKLLSPNEDTARFKREARAVAALSHPNVTRVYDHGESDGRPYIVLEYLGGGTLEDMLRAKGAPADEDTQAIAGEIAAGLAHAHTHGVVHRDLKPSNVLFDDEGRAKLSDFGIAHTIGDGTLTEAGTVLGTAAYISPEQAAGLPATAASDVYSFGVLLFRMLTGKPPFESDDPLALVVQHRDEPAPPVSFHRPDAPPVLAAIAEAALAKDPARRPADGAALVEALGVGALAAEDATRVLPVAAAARPRRRVGVVLGLAALAALALAGGVLAYEVTRPTDPPSPAGNVTPPVTTRKHHAAATTHAASTTRSAPTTTAATTTAATRPATTRAAPTTTHRVTTAPATTIAPPQTTTAATTAPTTAADTTTATDTTATTAPTTTGP